MKSTLKPAQVLGRLGGLSRARCLSPAHKKRIAAMGGKARGDSLRAMRRIAENFKYLQAVQGLSKSS